MNLDKFRLEDKNTYLFRPEQCIENMLIDLKKGKERGSTTYNEELDKCWTWRKQEANIWTGYANEGKALDIETYIPTPKGFTFIRDLEIGDQVFDENGNICNVTNVTDIMYGRKCYKVVFNDGTFVIADSEHQWVVDNIQARNSKNRQLKRGGETKKHGNDQRYKCLKSEVLTTEQILKNIKIGNKLNYSINVCKPVNYDKKELLINPYLLGFWLGDGTRGNGQITTADPEILEYFKQEGFEVTKHSGKYAYGILKFKEKLEILDICKHKSIPIQYLESSTEDRLALLQGLMDSDGYTDELGRCEFTTINWYLYQEVYRLMTSLGIKVYFTEDKATLNGKYISQRYRLRFKTSLPVFRLKRKLEKQLKGGKPKNNCRLIKEIYEVESRPVKCIEVDSPNHMYLCTENYIPTHNSLFLKQLCLIKALKDNWRFVFCSPEDFPPEEFYDDLIHTLAGQTTDKFYQNVISEEDYQHCYNLIKDKFLFLYIEPPHNTIKGTLEEFKKLCKLEKIDGCIIDPLLKFARPKDFSERDDIYASYIGAICIDFARQTNTSFHLVMHQVTPQINSDTNKYPEPSMYRVKGGGSYADGFDNVLSIWRPNYAKDKIDTEVQFASQKIKKQKLVGIPQRFQMWFDRKTNRYCLYNTTIPIFDFDEFSKNKIKK